MAQNYARYILNIATEKYKTDWKKEYIEIFKRNC